MPAADPHPFPEGMLTWTARDPDRGLLRAHGFAVLGWQALLEQFVAPARAVGAARRTSLEPPAAPLLSRFAAHRAVAVLGVCLIDLAALRILHDYVLRPAWQAGCRLLVHADWTLDELRAKSMVEEPYGHAFTLERAVHLTAIMAAARGPRPPHAPPTPSRTLDPEQTAAVAASDGVVQIIAPAGSCKTTVLVERVRELLARGTPAPEVLCTTFNKAAAAELKDRLARAGVTGVQARTFHSTGRMILTDERLLPGETRGLSLAQWRRLSALTSKATGTWIEPADAREAVSDIKLAHLMTAQEWERHVDQSDADDETRATAALYGLYEQQLRSDGAHDFDDQIMLAVRALRSDAQLRRRWQRRFTRVLVDEYQDIEPAQELLVQLLAAPEDSLFCVGDEDQTLYGWRRASVMRIVGLDQSYPALQRVALATNYRCPPAVVAASAQLISHNALRFPKTIAAAPGKPPDPHAVSLEAFSSPEQAAARAAGLLASSSRGQIVTLARTSRQLRTVALACVGPQIRISAPPAVFEARGAQAAVEAHLRLAADRASADAQDVLTVMRAPGRGLALDAERTVAARLRAGADWRQALAGQGRDPARLQDAAGILDLLASVTDAVRFVRALRTSFGLDRHFEEYERTFGGAEQTETEALADAERQAAGMTVAAYAEQIVARRDALLALRDDEHGVELATVHGAKGREWPTVVVFGFDEQQMPHAKSLEVTPARAAAGEGEQAERRVAYVALTRARRRLLILHTSDKLSPFGWQAGLAPPPPPRSSPSAATAGRRRALGDATLSKPARLDPSDAAREAIRAAPSRAEGLRTAARIVSDPSGALADVEIIDVLVEAPAMSLARAREILRPSGVKATVRVGRLSPLRRREVAAAVERWLAANP